MGPFRYIYLHESLKILSKYISRYIIYKYIYIYIYTIHGFVWGICHLIKGGFVRVGRPRVDSIEIQISIPLASVKTRLDFFAFFGIIKKQHGNEPICKIIVS